MARYIDADIVREKIKALYEHHIEMRNFSADGACSDCLSFLDDTPTADVVPRSEIERLTIELEAMRGAANSYKMHYKNLAREILGGLRQCFTVEKMGIFHANYIRDVCYEFEKKYTEGGEKDGI